MIIRKIILGLSVAGTLVFFGMDVKQKENILEHGTVMYIDLQVHDPRSLMQGDYMVLHYGLPSDMLRRSRRDSSELPEKGYAVVWLDSARVAWFLRAQEQPGCQSDTEHVIKYHLHNGLPVIGPPSYFFEEGTAECFSQARYVGVRVDESGELLITGLYDWDFCRLHEQDLATYREWLKNHKPPPPPPVNRRRRWFD